MKIENIESREYSAWFGKGDTKKDIEKIIDLHGEPEDILFGDANRFIACIIYPDKVFAVGYDGDEYKCHFEFKR